MYPRTERKLTRCFGIDVMVVHQIKTGKTQRLVSCIPLRRDDTVSLFSTSHSVKDVGAVDDGMRERKM